MLRKGLGHSCRLTGQNRVPSPPAMITAYIRLSSLAPAVAPVLPRI